MSHLPDIPLKIKKFNPLGFHLLQYMADPSIRLIISYGGSSSGKSFSMVQGVLLSTYRDAQNTCVFRKVGASITKSIYEDFKVAARQLGMMRHLTFKDSIRQIVHINGAKIDFSGVDDSEKIKGLSNYKRICLDEWSEFTKEDFDQIRKRLRGRPGQQIITAFNPIKETHWIKREIFDKTRWEDMPMDAVAIDGIKLPPELTKIKSLRRNPAVTLTNPITGESILHPSDTIVMQSTYLNNFWVVGSPDGTYGYYDEQCIADFEKDRINAPDFYNVNALGEWGDIRTGSEFFGSFNRARNISDNIEYDPRLPVHLSVDSNVLPYITVTYWQADTSAEGIHLKQIGETCAADPDNTVRRSARLTARQLRQWGCDRVYLHGDASTRNANNIDDEKRSFLDLFIDTLQGEGIEVIDVVSGSNPSVAMSGEFLNAVFDRQIDGCLVTIGSHCRTSIEDYLSVQKDANGAILKARVKNKTTGQTYEQHGHISDTLRYVSIDLMREAFLSFNQRRKRNLYARSGAIHYFNPDTECSYTTSLLYVIPYICGKAAAVHGRLCGKKWHIIDATVSEDTDVPSIKELVLSHPADTVIVECEKTYYPLVRELRESIPAVRPRREEPDIERRIASSASFVRDMLLFNPRKADSDPGYCEFVTALLDYRPGVKDIAASAAISGFVTAAANRHSEE